MSNILSNNPWIPYYRPRSACYIRLFCFTYGGGGASIYSKWQQFLPQHIEICPVQLPGHESRLRESLYYNLLPLIDNFLNDVLLNLNNTFALWGHSIGALICFELTRSIRRNKLKMPNYLFASGLAAPQFLKFYKPIYNLPDDKFITELKNHFYAPNEIFENEGLKELFLPIIKADFSIRDTYIYKSEPPLDCPITVFSGFNDISIKKEWLEGWREHTTDKFAIHMFPGDHFFLNTARLQLLNIISEELS